MTASQGAPDHAGDVSLLHALRPLVRTSLRLRRGEVVRRQGEPGAETYLQLRGWTAFSMVVAQGGRQMVKVHLPGDLLGLPDIGRPHAAGEIHALTDGELGVIDAATIGAILAQHPRLGASLFVATQDEHLWLMERLTSIGRMPAMQRIALLALHLSDRAREQAGADGDAADVPLTQQDIADLTGLTAVHVNRVLKRMRDVGLAQWRSGRLRIPARAALESIAGGRIRPGRDLSWLPTDMADTARLPG